MTTQSPEPKGKSFTVATTLLAVLAIFAGSIATLGLISQATRTVPTPTPSSPVASSEGAWSRDVWLTFTVAPGTARPDGPMLIARLGNGQRGEAETDIVIDQANGTAFARLTPGFATSRGSEEFVIGPDQATDCATNEVDPSVSDCSGPIVSTGPLAPDIYKLRFSISASGDWQTFSWQLGASSDTHLGSDWTPDGQGESQGRTVEALLPPTNSSVFVIGEGISVSSFLVQP